MRYREIVGVDDDADKQLRAALSLEEYAEVQRILATNTGHKTNVGITTHPSCDPSITGDDQNIGYFE